MVLITKVNVTKERNFGRQKMAVKGAEERNIELMVVMKKSVMPLNSLECDQQQTICSNSTQCRQSRRCNASSFCPNDVEFHLCSCITECLLNHLGDRENSYFVSCRSSSNDEIPPVMNIRAESLLLVQQVYEHEIVILCRNSTTTCTGSLLWVILKPERGFAAHFVYFRMPLVLEFNQS